MEIAEKYINNIFFSPEVAVAEGFNDGTDSTGGLFRATINVRNSQTKVEEGFYGQVVLDEKEKEMHKEKAICALSLAFKESDIYRSGEYEIQNALSLAWERLEGGVEN